MLKLRPSLLKSIETQCENVISQEFLNAWKTWPCSEQVDNRTGSKIKIIIHGEFLFNDKAMQVF